MGDSVPRSVFAPSEFNPLDSTDGNPWGEQIPSVTPNDDTNLPHAGLGELKLHDEISNENMILDDAIATTSLAVEPAAQFDLGNTEASDVTQKRPSSEEVRTVSSAAETVPSDSAPSTMLQTEQKDSVVEPELNEVGVLSPALDKGKARAEVEETGATETEAEAFVYMRREEDKTSVVTPQARNPLPPVIEPYQDNSDMASLASDASSSDIMIRLSSILVDSDPDIQQFRSLLLGSPTPFLISNTPNPASSLTLLHLAASRGVLPLVRCLVEEGGAIIDMEDREGETALHKASLRGKALVVSYLIGAKKEEGEKDERPKSSVHLVDTEGFAALHNAASKGYLDIVRLLCDKGGAAGPYDPEEPELGVNRRSKNGWTPLMCACANGHLPVVLYLLSRHNADPSIRNKFGDQAYDIAASVFEVYICSILEAAELPSFPLSGPFSYNVLAVHSTIPVLVWEYEALDCRLKTIAQNSGRPRFSASRSQPVLGSKGKAPFELRIPTGSRPLTGQSVDAEGITVRASRDEVVLPFKDRPFIFPMPRQGLWQESDHFWLGDFEVDLTHPLSSHSTGWSYATSFATPADQWSPSPPPGLQRILDGNAGPLSDLNWVRRRVWVRILKRRPDVLLPFLEPSGLTLDGFRPDGTRVEDDEGREMNWVPPAKVEHDYLQRAKATTRMRAHSDAASVRTLRGEADHEQAAVEARRRGGKLETAIAFLSIGISSDSDEERREEAQALLNAFTSELAELRERSGSNVEDRSDIAEDDDDDEVFIYPTDGQPSTLSFSPTSIPTVLRSTSTSSVNSPPRSSNGSFSIPATTTSQMFSENLNSWAPIPTSASSTKIRVSSQVLTPQLSHPQWERDEEVTVCRICNATRFSFYKRRHHCRKCGRICCNDCSMRRLKLEANEVVQDPYNTLLFSETQTPLRVCDSCYLLSTLPDAASPPTDEERMARSLSIGDASSQISDLADCPVCNRTLSMFGSLSDQEAHIRSCIEDGGADIQAGRYLIYSLSSDSSLIGVECSVCLEEFVAGSKVGR